MLRSSTDSVANGTERSHPYHTNCNAATPEAAALVLLYCMRSVPMTLAVHVHAHATLPGASACERACTVQREPATVGDAVGVRVDGVGVVGATVGSAEVGAKVGGAVGSARRSRAATASSLQRNMAHDVATQWSLLHRVGSVLQRVGSCCDMSSCVATKNVWQE